MVSSDDRWLFCCFVVEAVTTLDGVITSGVVQPFAVEGVLSTSAGTIW